MRNETKHEEPGMPTKNVNLTEHYSEFVDQLVASGRYKNASEVFRDGLRLLELKTSEGEQRLALLRSLAVEGFDQIDQGQGIETFGGPQLVCLHGRQRWRLVRSPQVRTYLCPVSRR